MTSPPRLRKRLAVLSNGRATFDKSLLPPPPVPRRRRTSVDVVDVEEEKEKKKERKEDVVAVDVAVLAVLAVLAVDMYEFPWPLCRPPPTTPPMMPPMLLVLALGYDFVRREERESFCVARVYLSIERGRFGFGFVDGQPGN